MDVAAPLSIWPFFYLTGIIITFFLSSLLLLKKGKARADYILAIWLFFLGVHLSLFCLVSTQTYLQWPYLLGFEIPLPLLHGPFLFLYTAEMTGQFPRKRTWLFHFVPAVIAYAAIMPFLLRTIADKIYVYQHDGEGYQLLTLCIVYAIKISGLVYIPLSLWLLRKHRRRILNQYSDTEKINLNWLRYLILGMAAIWLLVLLSDDVAIYAMVVAFVLFVSYFGIRQVGILNTGPQLVAIQEPEPQPVPARQETVQQQEKYLKSRLPQEMVDRIHSELTRVMAEEKLYTDPELTLSDLSKRLDVHPNNLSQVINLVEEKNFYDYVNLFRVAAFEKLLAGADSQKYTLLSLAFECGFNSKASFNRNFKKYRGITPTEYQKQLAQQNG